VVNRSVTMRGSILAGLRAVRVAVVVLPNSLG
jgi:hypothetical protein